MCQGMEFGCSSVWLEMNILGEDFALRDGRQEGTMTFPRETHLQNESLNLFSAESAFFHREILNFRVLDK